jgi:hypothetical protein
VCPLSGLEHYRITFGVRCALGNDCTTMDAYLKDVPPPAAATGTLTADLVLHGHHIPPQQQLLLYSADQWEGFVQEWAHYCLKAIYCQVQGFSGPGDRGIDIAGFTDADKLNGVWDNYQCKHYDHALHPRDAFPEIGKLLLYTFTEQFRVPRRYYFVAPKGAGTSLNAYLANAPKLSQVLVEKWDKYCRKKITSTQEIPLEGKFLDYVQAFDFTIFEAKTSLQLVDDHKSCPCHTARFGGGLPPRPDPTAPPEVIAPTESRYVEQLFKAYADRTKKAVSDALGLKQHPQLREHFLRQRVSFYHAESLRVFARDSVPPGTFESFQEEIYTGVVDTHDAAFPDGYERVVAVTKAARDMQITSNALITRAKPQDRDGICHQLANEDRLRWTKP